MPQLPEKEVLCPVVQIDAASLTGLVTELHTTMLHQNKIIELMERESSKRKMETDIAMRNMRSEFDAKVTNEAKKRIVEMQKTQALVSKEILERQQDIKLVNTAIEESIVTSGKYVDKQIAPLKMVQQQQTVKQLTFGEELKSQQAKLRDLQTTISETNEVFTAKCGTLEREAILFRQMFSLTKEDVATAVETDKQTEKLSLTPAFQDINAVLAKQGQAVKLLDANIKVVATDLNSTDKSLRSGITDTESDIANLFRKNSDLTSKFEYFSEVSSTKLERLFSTVSFKTDLEVFAKNDEVSDNVKNARILEEELRTLLDVGISEREALARELQKKADWITVTEKIDKDEVDSQFRQFSQKFYDLSETLEEIRAGHLFDMNENKADTFTLHRERSVASLVSLVDSKPASPVASRVEVAIPPAPRPAPVSVDAIPRPISRVKLEATPASVIPIIPDGKQSPRQKATCTPPVHSSAEIADATEASAVYSEHGFSSTKMPSECLSPVSASRRLSSMSVGGKKSQAQVHVMQAIQTSVNALQTEVHSKMLIIETDIQTLDHEKVGRKELHKVLQELVGLTATSANNPANNMGNVGSGVVGETLLGDPSTALRFRCLSCNRNAGSLAEGGGGRGGNVGHFPPSSVFLKNEKETRRTPEKTRPGSPMSTTRKKLLNYYDWLRGKGGQSAMVKAQNLTVEDYSPRRSGSPTWDGAQSGGGEPKTRQCGDHGSKNPSGIGSDGRFYCGVKTKTVDPPGDAASNVIPADQAKVK